MSSRTTYPRRLTATAATLAVTAVAALGLTTAPAMADGCPNTTLRAEDNSTELPECRAYEMVTSPFKEGFAPTPEAFTDTGAFAYISAGSFAGNGLGGAFNQYVATRTTTGWTTASLNPSGPVYAVLIHQGAEALSADLQSSLWDMRLAGESAEVLDYYLRAPNGTFTLVGPGSDHATLPPGSPGPITTGAAPIEQGNSADLSHVLFSLTNGGSLFEYAATANSFPPRSVSIDNAGQQATAQTGGEDCTNRMSTDGRVVIFSPGCNGGVPQVWARVSATTTIDASASRCTRTAGDAGGACNAPAAANYAGAATDDSRVFFTTTQQLSDGDIDQTNDLYACAIPSSAPTPEGTTNACPSLTEISATTSDANVESTVHVSDDGSHVYFTAHGVLASNLGATDLAAVPGANNLYVWQMDDAHPAGATTFIASLESDDADGQSTADGRYLVFNTSSRLLPSDTDEVQDVYRYDSATGRLLRLSTDAAGSGGNEPGRDATARGATTTGQPRTVMSADASTVVFQTSEALSPADTDGTTDVYVWHEGQVAPVTLHGGGSPWITPSGTDIFFVSGSQLTAGDLDTNADIYDARIDGGFPVTAPPSCAEEGCEGAITPQPQTFAAAGSAAFNGPPDTAPVQTAPSTPHTAAPPTRAQKLAKALRACRTKHNRHKRTICERSARAAYRRAGR